MPWLRAWRGRLARGYSRASDGLTTRHSDRTAAACASAANVCTATRRHLVAARRSAGLGLEGAATERPLGSTEVCADIGG